MVTRSTVVTAALAAAMAMTATGSTFTSAATIESARPARPARPAQPAQAAPVVRQAAAPASTSNGGGDAGKGDQGGGGEGRGNDEGGGGEGRGNDEGRGGEGRGNDEGGGGEGRGYGGGRGYDEGRIHFNDRTYSAYPGGCITAASGLGATSFNIFNESRRTVEVFSGATCDNGGPVAVVGPYGATSGVFPQRVDGGVFVNYGVGASFRVIGYDF
ncbi:hypothetical protein GCM10010207_48800 [Streptomyces atratus]|uniref:hypothetical protein n=1 Tax=Streptomyces atratus TaxID=1893 RepID=UPI00167045CB|nr:hypothetical protein [Streptomyces atratus]GGT42824.1 hypothetical protein GCM10010207_48800 [Streptomyces atratus]